MKTLNTQGTEILAAIKSGIAAMTPDRWHAVRVLAAEYEDDGEWFAPEFDAARKASEGISWDFTTWRDTADILESGGRLGGVDLRDGTR